MALDFQAGMFNVQSIEESCELPPLYKTLELVNEYYRLDVITFSFLFLCYIIICMCPSQVLNLKTIQQASMERQTINDYHNEVARIAEGIKPYLKQYIRYSNLSDLFESTNEGYKEKVLRQVNTKVNETIVSNNKRAINFQ